MDLFATVIEASGGTPSAETRHSESLLLLIKDGVAPHSEITYGMFGQGVCTTDGEWTLFKTPVEGQELFSCSTMISRLLLVDNPVEGRVGHAPAQPVGQAHFDSSVPHPM